MVPPPNKSFLPQNFCEASPKRIMNVAKYFCMIIPKKWKHSADEAWLISMPTSCSCPYSPPEAIKAGKYFKSNFFFGNCHTFFCAPPLFRWIESDCMCLGIASDLVLAFFSLCISNYAKLAGFVPHPRDLYGLDFRSASERNLISVQIGLSR